jgi:hypothetical protein
VSALAEGHTRLNERFLRLRRGGLMLGVDPETGALSLHLWVAVGSAALLVAFCAVAIFRIVPALRVEVLILGALLGAVIAWAALDREAAGDPRAEGRALQARAGELAARTLAPGSPLGCLDALVGDNVEAACEKAIFTSPASVAAATSYVAARLALLSEITAYVGRGGTQIDDVLLPLRHALEADRFGFLAHLLVVRDGCTRENCDALTLLHDAERVRAHLSEGTLDQLVAQYATAWAQPTEGALADAQARLAASAQAAAQPSHRPVNIDFPTAASIPPISIMTPEPKGPVLPGVAAAAGASPNPQPATPPARHGRKQQTSPAPQPTAQAGAPAAAVEPIWPEPVPSPPPQAQSAPPPVAAQSALAPAAEAPMRLNPFPPPPEASAGMTVGAQ